MSSKRRERGSKVEIDRIVLIGASVRPEDADAVRLETELALRRSLASGLPRRTSRKADRVVVTTGNANGGASGIASHVASAVRSAVEGSGGEA